MSGIQKESKGVLRGHKVSNGVQGVQVGCMKSLKVSIRGLIGYDKTQRNPSGVKDVQVGFKGDQEVLEGTCVGMWCIEVFKVANLCIRGFKRVQGSPRRSKVCLRWFKVI